MRGGKIQFRKGFLSLLFTQMSLLWINSEAVCCMSLTTLTTLAVPRSSLPTAQEARPLGEGGGEEQVAGTLREQRSYIPPCLCQIMKRETTVSSSHSGTVSDRGAHELLWGRCPLGEGPAVVTRDRQSTANSCKDTDFLPPYEGKRKTRNKK